MAFDIIHAARRAEMAAVVVHGHAVAGQCDFRDVETLCAAVMQLSQCCMYVSAALTAAGLTTRFEDSEILLGRGVLPPQHAKAIREHFRESFEGPRPSDLREASEETEFP